jgi:hypothetical protein
MLLKTMQSATRAIHPLLIRSGWSRETVTAWSDRIDEGVSYAHLQPMWLKDRAEMSHLKDQLVWRIRLCWGRRRAAENMPAPPLPVVNEDADASLRTDYPYYQVHNTREESLAQTALRNQGKNLPPPSHPADTKAVASVS